MGVSSDPRPTPAKTASERGLYVALAAWCGLGCGETSLVIGGDPELQSYSAAGAAAVGGAGVVGPGAGGTGSGGIVPLGVGGSEPYPAVHWENGQADASYCPNGGALGIACLHIAVEPIACDPAGQPSCNGCSCIETCFSSSDCASGSNGAPGVCVLHTSGANTCFLGCETDPCPLGMVCASHPGGSRVCLWTDPGSTQAPAR